MAWFIHLDYPIMHGCFHSEKYCRDHVHESIFTKRPVLELKTFSLQSRFPSRILWKYLPCPHVFDQPELIFFLICFKVPRNGSWNCPSWACFSVVSTWNSWIEPSDRFFGVCLKPLFPATMYDVFFQHNLSQYSKVLQQQEVVKVGRRPVNICYNYSLVMRIVTTKVWVTPFVLLALITLDREPEGVPRGAASPRAPGSSGRSHCRQRCLLLLAAPFPSIKLG